jgi:hypothetical protein
VQLFYALSQLQVSIISGDARQVKIGEWSSKFVLDFTNSSANASHLDYAGFAERDAALNKTWPTPSWLPMWLARFAI